MKKLNKNVEKIIIISKHICYNSENHSFCVNNNNNNNNSIQLFVGVKEKHNKINKGFILQSWVSTMET